MRHAHFIEMRVFCKEGDNEEKILEKIHEIFPFDFKKEKIDLKIQTAHGFDDKKIRIVTVSIDKERNINLFLRSLMNNFQDDQRALLLKQLESRLDKDLNFYLRLDKDKLLDGEYWITDSGNCFHIRISVAAYPHNRENAIETLKQILKL